MCENLPIRFEEHLLLTDIGIKQSNISFQTVTMESDRFICVREKCGDSQEVVIVDLLDKTNPVRRPVYAESALMNPVSKVIALKGKHSSDSTSSQNTLQIFNLEMKSKLKSFLMPQEVIFWKWISLNTLALVTEKSVFHWVMEGNSIPVKIFDRHSCLAGAQIINYRADSKQLWVVLIGIAAKQTCVAGTMQLYSVERKCSQPIEGHVAAFVDFKLIDNPNVSSIFCFAGTTSQKGKLHVVELGLPPVGNRPFTKKSVDILFPVDAQNDFPVAMQTASKYGTIYLITKMGYIYIYDIETVTCIYLNRISTDTIFITALYESAGGIIGLNRKGQVLSVTIDDNNIIPYINNILKNPDLALRIATRCNLSGAEELFIQKFNSLFREGKFYDAAKVAAVAPKQLLRTAETMQLFQKAHSPPGQMSPILQYFGVLLDQGQLNKLESIEISRPVLIQGKKELLEKWLKEFKIECSEELGDLVKHSDQNLALSIYLRANVPSKVVQCFAENGDFNKIVSYAKKVNYTPNYLFLFETLIQQSCDKALNFSLVVLKEDFSSIDLNKIVEIFMERNLVKECTSFLLEALKDDKPSDGPLQTKLLELNLMSAPHVADCILGNRMFSHYDRNHIARMCENVGLIQKSLENYTDISDIKRIIVLTHLIDAEWLVLYFGTLTVSDALECLNVLLDSNGQDNLNIVVKVAIKYYQQLTFVSLIDLFEKFKRYDGLFQFLSPLVNLISNEEVHFKYIQASCETGKIKELERICRESNSYCPEKIKNYLKEANLSDPTPLMIVCDRFNFENELVLYLFSNNCLHFINKYTAQINPSKLPKVIGSMLDIGCSDDAIKNIIQDVSFSFEELVTEVDKRDRLKVLLEWLEKQVNNGSTDPIIHNALAKIHIDCNLEAERFLRENKFYDSRVVGNYCEKINPLLACIAYERGQCESELINVYNSNGLFKLEAKYLIKKKSLQLWSEVLNRQNPNINSLVEQIIHSAILETEDPDEISTTVKAFMSADFLHELISLLEKLLFTHSAFGEERNLQNLLILTAIKVEPSKLMGYINKLNNYDAQDIAHIAINNNLFEEGFTILKKFNVNTSAMQVIVENLKNLERAYDFAVSCNDPSVWNQLGVAQLQNGFVKESIESFVKANNPSSCKEVVQSAKINNCWNDLIKYLEMAAKATRDTFTECELVYSYAVTNRLSELEEFISKPNHADIEKVGDRCYKNELYGAAKLLYNNVSNFSKLATTLIHLNDYQNAVDCARKANKTQTWKEVCFACIDGEEYRFAHMCALHIIVQADEIENLIRYYEEKGNFEQVILVFEAALGLERVHMGIFTELGNLYCKYKPQKLKEHIELFWSRMNIPKVMRKAEELHLWSELVLLHEKFEQYENAINIIIDHATECWNGNYFNDLITKSTNSELLLKAIHFYIDYKPLLLNDLLITLSPKLDNPKTVSFIEIYSHLGLVKEYLKHIQYLNNDVINNAINNLLIEDNDFEGLRLSVDSFDNFDSLSLAKKLENHNLIEFKRLAAYLYNRKHLWQECIEICKANGLFQDGIHFAAESRDVKIAEGLLQWFFEQRENDCFVACLFLCYSLLRPDFVLEIAWCNNAMDLAMPYMIQLTKDYISKVNKLEELEALRFAEENTRKNNISLVRQISPFTPNNSQRSLQFYTTSPTTCNRAHLFQGNTMD